MEAQRAVRLAHEDAVEGERVIVEVNVHRLARPFEASSAEGMRAPAWPREWTHVGVRGAASHGSKPARPAAGRTLPGAGAAVRLGVRRRCRLTPERGVVYPRNPDVLPVRQ